MENGKLETERKMCKITKKLNTPTFKSFKSWGVCARAKAKERILARPLNF